jgi:hypothetical protein
MKKYINCTNKEQMTALLNYLFSVGYSYEFGVNSLELLHKRLGGLDYFDYPYIVIAIVNSNKLFSLYNNCLSVEGNTKITLEEFFSLTASPTTFKWKLNDKYEAIIDKNGKVKVGCAEFDLSNIKEMIKETEKHFG